VRLALTLGRTLEEVLCLSAQEIEIWKAWYAGHGFPSDRLEWTAAIGAAYTGSALGGKAKPKDLLPKFGNGRAATREDKAAVMAWFAARSKKKGD
jgi:hypothetical protein